MPHSSALLTPTRTPHACLLKHWEGRIVSLALVRYPRVYHMLSCSSTAKDELSRWRWSDTHACTTCSLAHLWACMLPRLHAYSLAHFFPRVLQLSLSFWLACPLAFFSPERTSNSFLPLGTSAEGVMSLPPSVRLSVRPLLACLRDNSSSI